MQRDQHCRVGLQDRGINRYTRIGPARNVGQCMSLDQLALLCYVIAVMLAVKQC
jgi:hypothetical protein